MIFVPYAEGAERVNRAIQGVNLHHIEYPDLDLSDRLWTAITGVLLMIPLINSVIWVAMQSLGSPEKLSEPF
jgi:hypothetical protein